MYLSFSYINQFQVFIGLKKVVWVIGSSIVYWAARSTSTRPGGKDLTLQTKNITILWFGIRGMKWQDFDSTFEKKLKFNPHHYYQTTWWYTDLVILPGAQSFPSIIQSSNMSMVWSDMLARLYWHNARSAASVDSMHKKVNRKVKQFLKSEGGG